MKNLWDETIGKLTYYGKTFEDVCYIQGSDFKITKENFEQVAKESDYYSGYGSAQVAYDLVLVGKGWWLERSEYDGAEWWEFKEAPKEINEIKEVKHFTARFGGTLVEVNDPELEEL